MPSSMARQDLFEKGHRFIAVCMKAKMNIVISPIDGRYVLCSLMASLEERTKLGKMDKKNQENQNAWNPGVLRSVFITSVKKKVTRIAAIKPTGSPNESAIGRW